MQESSRSNMVPLPYIPLKDKAVDTTESPGTCTRDHRSQRGESLEQHNMGVNRADAAAQMNPVEWLPGLLASLGHKVGDMVQCESELHAADGL